MSFKRRRLYSTPNLIYCNVNNFTLIIYCFNIKILINAMLYLLYSSNFFKYLIYNITIIKIINN